MRIADVVKHKGSGVVTVRSDATVAELVDLLSEHRIGAVVVSDDGSSVNGIVSERDIVLHLKGGADVLGSPVSRIMTAEVHTCDPDDNLESLAALMTEHRIRHVPVVADGALHAIVSIGDVVKSRIDALQSERDQLRDYIQQAP
jgi:CBS domain-containing protein